MLELRDVHAGYGEPSTAPVLSGFDLTLAPGERRGLFGVSGAGKTTVVRLLTFRLTPRSGSYLLDGEPVRGTEWDVPAGLRRRVGLVLQSPRAAADPRMRLRRAVTEPLRTLPRGLRPDARETERRLAAALELAQFPAELLDRLPEEVSEGQLARAMLARAVMAEPSYLVCDEPTASLDSATARAIWDGLAALADGGVGVLVVSHHEAELAEWADDVVRLG